MKRFFYSKEQLHTSKIKDAFEKEAAKQLHAHLNTDKFKKNVTEHTKDRAKINIESETESYINEAKDKWLEDDAATIFLEQAKAILKEDFFDILEKLRLPGKPAQNSWSLIKRILNPLLALTGTTGIGIGAGLFFLSMNPPAGIALAIGGSAVDGVFLSRVITDSEKECEKALQILTEESLRKYIRMSKQADINNNMKKFFEVDVIEKMT